MYFGKKQQLDWTFSLIVCDVFACLIATVVAPWFFGHLTGYSFDLPWPSAFVFLILLLVSAKHLRLYSWTSFRKPVSACPRIFVAAGLATAAFAVLFWVFGGSWNLPFSYWLASLFTATFVLFSLARAFIYFLLARVLKAVQIEKIAFVAGGVRLDRVLAAVSDEMGAFHQAEGYFSDAPLEGQKSGVYRWLGPIADMERHLIEEKVTLLLVEENTVSNDEMGQIADACGRTFVGLKVIPSVFDFWSTRLSFRTVAGIPLMGVFDLKHDRFHNQFIKRAMDIVGGITGLVLFSPVIAVLGVLIYLESPGPIFFRQRRAGMNGIPFEIVKLRSMKLDAESDTGQVWAVEDDPRRLRIGKFMRARNLDELPQFWNVLKGDMSLVGPRPEMYDLVQQFSQTVRHYNLRHTLRPGLTGWAAVHGLRGNTSLEERIEYDLFYIEHWSLRLDILILFMTLLPPKNAY